MTDDLIARLQIRIKTHPATDLECVPAIRPRPPLTLAAIEDAERDLGFRLPPLLRSIYLNVADGGYGPGWGLLPLNIENKPSVVMFDRYTRSHFRNGLPPEGWPEPYLRFCEWGCNIYSGVDCSTDACAVIRCDPMRGSENEIDWLIPERESLAQWLLDWLDGTLQFELSQNKQQPPDGQSAN